MTPFPNEDGCGLLCKYNGLPGSVKPNACIEITICADPFDPIRSSTFRLIHNNGNMDEPVDYTID